MKRIRGEKSSYLTFITNCDCEDGMTMWQRVDTHSTKDSTLFENLFEYVFVTRRNERRSKDWSCGRYELGSKMMAWVRDEIMVPDDESTPLKKLDLGGMDPIAGFPHDWTRDDWGNWCDFEIEDMPVAVCKHYFYHRIPWTIH